MFTEPINAFVFQIANYGIGGHYEPHYDWTRNFKYSKMKKLGQGNRIATALLYVSRLLSQIFIGCKKCC